jgi:hypothetical protein
MRLPQEYNSTSFANLWLQRLKRLTTNHNLQIHCLSEHLWLVETFKPSLNTWNQKLRNKSDIKCAPPGIKITEVTSRIVASCRVTGKLGQEVVSGRLPVIHGNLIYKFSIWFRAIMKGTITGYSLAKIHSVSDEAYFLRLCTNSLV